MQLVEKIEADKATLTLLFTKENVIFATLIGEDHGFDVMLSKDTEKIIIRGEAEYIHAFADRHGIQVDAEMFTVERNRDGLTLLSQATESAGVTRTNGALRITGRAKDLFKLSGRCNFPIWTTRALHRLMK